MKHFTYTIELDLASSPEQLWPLVSNTDRFNRDAGVPAVERNGVGPNARRRLSLTKLGLPVAWEEEPFEWVSPHRFSVLRRYTKGPVASMRTSATLQPRDGGGTHLVYAIDATPRGLLGWFAIPIGIGIQSRRRFADVIRRYDRAASDTRTPLPAPKPQLAPRGQARIEAIGTRLVELGADPELTARLGAVIASGDELTVAHIRPYVLADSWGTDHRETLELCLRATREGLLELHWELLCPSCRGAAAVESTLGELGGRVHCETCLINFEADFDRSVELTFRPATSIRPVSGREFCVGSPQLTPHVVAQQLVPAGERRDLQTELEPGSYRLRTLGAKAVQAVRVDAAGALQGEASLQAGGWRDGELTLAGTASLTLENATGDEQLLVLERIAWGDRTATAAEVTSLQLFRDLFASEVLRPGEPVAVQSLTVVFTDLRGSSRYYRELGDAPAFAAVLQHLDILKTVVADEDGAVVKAMGDAIMAVFPRPVAAVKAMMRAQTVVAGKPLDLKVGLHTGRCMAVNQNGVLDYFGSTVNLAARLVGLSSGGNLVVSGAVLADPEVAALGLQAVPVEGMLKGFEDEQLELWRLSP